MHSLKKWVLIWLWLGFAGLAQADAQVDFARAIVRDNESTVIALTLRGFDLNTPNEEGEPGLTQALRLGSLSVAGFLLSQPNVDVQARNRQGETPLMMAALKGHLVQARRLIERGAEVNKPGWTPLHYAATGDTDTSLDLVRLMLTHYAYIDAESPNRSTPLMMAARYGRSEVVKLLLEEGADTTVRNQQGLSALDFAQQAGRSGAASLIAAHVRAQQPAGRW